MSASRRFRSHSDRGAAAVELALISVPLFLLLFGIVQFGFTFYSQITISQAAREGARAISLNVGTSTAGTCDSSCISAAKTRMINAAKPLVLTDANFSPSPTTCTPGSDQTTSSVVTISYKVSVELLFTLTISGKASMPCGG